MRYFGVWWKSVDVAAPTGHIGNTFSEHIGNTFRLLRETQMPWKECYKMDERMRFVARLTDGEKMAALVPRVRYLAQDWLQAL